MNEWTIEIEGPPLTKLEESIRQGAIRADGRRLLTEETVGNIGGLRVQVFSREHPPPHFRVIHQGISNNFTIKDCQPLNGEALKRFFRNIREWHAEHKPGLIEAWNRNRPADCPVGRYTDD
ncbi:DUF4160 domain-containing protein [Leptonema illini]|uniref:DUF4160 domain-containing protein n=1 Tax=Leptonema illini TaxID=183 RepID=UPI000990F8B6|nr:DUF4160 domain-containing protein [Leptonema illini]